MRSEILRPLDYQPFETRCSSFDRLIGFTSPSLAFCYDERLDVDRLRAALLRVLPDFSIFAGRFVKRDGALFIEHGALGVVFETCESAERSVNLGRAGNRDLRAAKRVVPSLHGLRPGRSTPLTTVRVTQTADGSVVGITYNHAIGDLQSIMHLFQAWAHAYRGEAYDGPFSLNDRTAYLAQRMPALDGPTSQFVAPWSEWPRHTARFITRGADLLLLEFSWEELSKLHAAASRMQSVTVHDALCAHVFSLIHRQHRPDRRAMMMLSFNYRKRLGMPDGTIGNFFDGLKTKVEPTDDVASIAAALRTQVKEFPRRMPYAQELDQLHALHPQASRRLRCVDGDIDPRDVGTFVTMSTHKGADLYQFAFASANPVAYCIRAAESMCWFTLAMETPDDAGLHVQVLVPRAVSTRVAQEHARLRAAGFSSVSVQ